LHEDIDSIVHKETNPMYDNYVYEGSGGDDIEITKNHLALWYELNMHHDFQDLVATCMEL
jgi:hypothetical protein